MANMTVEECRINRRECPGNTSWSGKMLMTIIIVLSTALASIGGIALTNAARASSIAEQQKRTDDLVNARLIRIENKIDELRDGKHFNK